MPFARIVGVLNALTCLRSPGRVGWAALCAIGRHACLAMVVLCLPLQGLATAIGHIDGLAHVHRAPRAGVGPLGAGPPALPAGMPVLLSVDELRHSHGAPRRAAAGLHDEAPHHHAGVARHAHAADDASVVAVADPGDDATLPTGGKRILIDVDTPPAGLPAVACDVLPRRPPVTAAQGGPEPALGRLERPPRRGA